MNICLTPQGFLRIPAEHTSESTTPGSQVGTRSAMSPHRPAARDGPADLTAGFRGGAVHHGTGVALGQPRTPAERGAVRSHRAARTGQEPEQRRAPGQLPKRGDTEKTRVVPGGLRDAPAGRTGRAPDAAFARAAASARSAASAEQGATCEGGRSESRRISGPTEKETGRTTGRGEGCREPRRRS